MREEPPEPPLPRRWFLVILTVDTKACSVAGNRDDHLWWPNGDLVDRVGVLRALGQRRSEGHIPVRLEGAEMIGVKVRGVNEVDVQVAVCKGRVPG